MNTAKLKGKMAELDVSQSELAEYLGLSRSTFCLKLNGKGYFSTEESRKIVAYMGLSLLEGAEIFLQ